MLWVTNTASQEISLARLEWHSLLTPIRLSMSASRINWSLTVSHVSQERSTTSNLYSCSLESVINPTRHIELDIDIGADARDWSAIQAQEKLKPVETELRRIEELVGEIVGEMDYLRTREQKLRDTNESTNERVKWFAFGTMGMLVGLGAWQVVYLRAYFRCVSRLVYEAGEVRLIDVSQIETLDLVVRCMVFSRSAYGSIKSCMLPLAQAF